MKNVTKLLTRLFMLMVFSTLLFQNVGTAANQITIGSGTLGYNIPFDGYYYNGRAQYLYTAAEMAGLYGGQFTKLGFYISANAGGWLDPLTISVKNTSATALGTGFDETGFTVVWTGYWDPSIGWYDFVLQNPFVWDGTSNIIINICFNDSEWGYSYTRAYHTAMPNSNYCRYYKSDGGVGCSFSTSYSLAARLNVRIYQPTGTLNGVVTSAYYGTPLVGALVAGPGGIPFTNTIAGGAYTMPVAAGTTNYTASAANYMPMTKQATVPEDGTSTLNFALNPNPAVLTGIVTNAANGNPVKGARVEVNGYVTYSIAGGVYSMNIFPGGTFPVNFQKAGFSDTTSDPILLTTGVTTTLNMAMQESWNNPGIPFLAALNSAVPPTAVNLSWNLPSGEYELIYDDGTPEISTVWGAEGNMNAVKFTALNYPITTLEGKVHIGNAIDYPDGTDPAALAPFQMQIYDATGLNGMPGQPMGDPIDITPANFGWNTFVLPNLNITSGNFYLVMTQGGVPPEAARLGVDTTATQLRSYSRFVTGGGQWLPAMGNFLIRATVYGVGGPLDGVEAVLNYDLYRLVQGQEGQDPTTWTHLSSPTGLTATDNSWPSLPDGAYRWAVRAKYTGNHWSGFTFSNVLGKNWTAPVTVNVFLTCTANPVTGTVVTLHNVNFDSTYIATLTTSNTVVFPNVWKGDYLLTVARFNYTPFNTSTTIMGPMTYDVNLLQIPVSPTGMAVNDHSLVATWNKPFAGDNVFFEDWGSGSFGTNGWTSETNWSVYSYYGNPAPSAMFSWYPEQLSYEYSITSKNITPSAMVPGANHIQVGWDINLNNFSPSGSEGLSAEIWNGTSWETLKEYVNSSSIAWTSEKVTLPSSWDNKTFKIRFRAWGDDSFWINYWYVDNVYVYAVGEDLTPCILAYNVYLKNLSNNSEILSGVTLDTTYTIPFNQVEYGTNYRACVTAVYGSGYSQRSCDEFTSNFLCPPTALTGTPIESTAYLTWTKPSCTGGGPPAQWIFWCGDFGDNAIGAGVATWSCAARWTPDQITALNGGSVTKIMFWPYSAGTFNIRVWQGANAANLIVDQLVPSITIGQENIVDLATPALIDVTQELWIGYQVISPGNFPAGVDFGPAVQYYGDMIYYAGAWSSMAVAYGLNYNWYIKGYIETVKNATAPVVLKQDMPTSTDLTPTAFRKTEPPATVLSPRAPLAGPTQLGYKVYRDGAEIAYIPDKNTVEYYDYNLEPGTYSYEVTAWYDVAPIPPLEDQSLPAGPVDVIINYGRPLPFFEPWDAGNFTYNDWVGDSPYPVIGPNWSVNVGFGNPAPTADFSWVPATTDYSQMLASPILSAAVYTCADIYLDFDYKLIDRNATGAEFLDASLFKDGSWSSKATFANSGSVDWNHQSIKLAAVAGKAFRVGFRAYGANSEDILHWYVDNIHVYAVCRPPQNLIWYNIDNRDVYLSWIGPNCKQGPAPTWLQWDDGTNVDAIGLTAGGSFDVAAKWDPDMIATLAGGSITKVRIFPYDDATFVFKVWTGPDGANLVYEQPFTPPIGDWYDIIVTSPVLLDVGQELWVGYNATHNAGYFPCGVGPGPCVVGYGFLANLGTGWEDLSAYFDYNWDIEVLVETAKNATKPVTLQSKPIVNTNTDLAAHGKTAPRGHANDNVDVSSLQGYNVWRQDPDSVNYHKVNSTLLTDTVYFETVPVYGLYHYYVTAEFVECTSAFSNILPVDIVVGIDPLTNGSITIYPNPATDNVNVKSDYTISQIEVMNYVGQTVYNKTSIEAKVAKINVVGFQSGVYFVKVTTSQGVRTVKITVTK